MNLVATRWWSMRFMPSCVLRVGIVLGVFLMLRAWRRGKRPGEARFACWLTGASVVMLYLASTPLVARWAAWTLEKDYPPVDVKTLPVADAIVVLGGAMYATEGGDGVVHLYAHHAGDRFETGLAAFEAGRAPLIVFGGGETGCRGRRPRENGTVSGRSRAGYRRRGRSQGRRRCTRRMSPRELRRS